MTERAAQLINHVFPYVPVRQWVLTVPHALRYRLGYDHNLCRRVHEVFRRALFRHYRDRCAQPEGQSGSVTFIQRFNSALGLSPHFHLVAIDGVFSADRAEQPRFTAAAEPSDLDVAAVLASTRAGVARLLRALGLDQREDEAAEDPLTLETPALAAFYGGSIVDRSALDSSRSAQRLGAAPNAPWVDAPRIRHSHQDGFDLHAGRALDADDRSGLDKLLRYGGRPASAQDRLALHKDGRVSLTLKRPYHDGTTKILFTPTAFLERLAALIPKPRKNLVIYSGVLAPNAKLRRQVVHYGRGKVASDAAPGTHADRERDDEAASALRPAERPNYAWAQLMQRSFGIDVLLCKHCGGRLRLLCAITRPETVRTILRSLGLPAEVDEPAPARAPPDDFMFETA